MPQMIVQADGTLKEVSGKEPEQASKGAKNDSEGLPKGQVDPKEFFKMPSNKTEDELLAEQAEEAKKQAAQPEKKLAGKFDRPEDLEKGYIESEKAMHEKAQEASRLKKEKEDLEAQNKVFQRMIIEREEEKKKSQKLIDPVKEMQQAVRQSLSGMEQEFDPKTIDKLAEVITTTSEKMARKTIEQERENARQIEEGKKYVLNQLKPLELDAYYDSLFLPIFDAKFQDPIFRAYPDDQKMKIIVGEMQGVIESVKKQVGEAIGDSKKASEALNSMTGSSGQIPLKTKKLEDDNKLGSMADDLKAMRNHQREKAAKAL